jgi:hypothetical protein
LYPSLLKIGFAIRHAYKERKKTERERGREGGGGKEIERESRVIEIKSREIDIVRT